MDLGLAVALLAGVLAVLVFAFVAVCRTLRFEIAALRRALAKPDVPPGNHDDEAPAAAAFLRSENRVSPFRSYAVEPDGSVVFSDGERVHPDVTKVNPPAMRILE